MAEIFLYTGTVLIAFEIIRDVSHLPTIATIFWWILFNSISKYEEKILSRNKFIVFRILVIILTSIILFLIFVVTVIIAIITILIWMFGTALFTFNRLINNIYINGLKQVLTLQDSLLLRIYKFVIPNIKQEDIESAYNKINIRFIAIIGVILITVGFILKF
jgi:hypothetical protein